MLSVIDYMSNQVIMERTGVTDHIRFLPRFELLLL